MKGRTGKNFYDSPAHIEYFLVGFVLLILGLYFIIAGRRFFDFDEFQVLYASAAIARGKSFYVDGIENHFPLANLFLSVPVYLMGHDESILLLSRYIIFILNSIMLLYVYRIGSLLWSRIAGLLAVSSILVSVVFLQKGIEIRHDVFNALFNVMGAYYGFAFIKKNNSRYLVLSSLSFGMALASTQKAIVMIAGFIIGLVVFLLRNKRYKTCVRIVLGYLSLIPVPLAVCLMVLITISNDNFEAFLQHAVIDVIIGYAPYTTEIYPFPYDRLSLFKNIFLGNILFYVLVFLGIVSNLCSIKDGKEEKVIIGIWAALGLAFYVTSKRPFYQTLLPAIPPIALIAGGLLGNFWKYSLEWNRSKQFILSALIFAFLLILPLRYFKGNLIKDDRFERALLNAAICLENLESNEKTLCFTQNQLFFDPVFKMSNDECGRRIYDFDVECFKKRMIDAQCKIIINDYRTRLLNKEVKKRIAENYLSIEMGDILIPGFRVPPKKSIFKDVWIEGTYYSPIFSLELDGRKIEEKIFYLNKGHHTFLNPTTRPIMLVYIFKPHNLKTIPWISPNKGYKRVNVRSE
ncbi:MAG: glycosyltransferase family 39 protein [Deltaproteobacteria bacterium]|nr:glycosyltransferase family 39 protein [Deltaproteobacteria bacterium]